MRVAVRCVAINHAINHWGPHDADTMRSDPMCSDPMRGDLMVGDPIVWRPAA